MITLFGPIRADVVESALPYLKVRPERKLSGTVQTVSAKVGRRAFRLRVRSLGRDVDGMTWVEIVNRMAYRDQLRRDLQTSLDDLEERRVSHRDDVQYSVRSPDLPNFRATTVDVSSTGLRLATSGPVEVGTRLCLEIDERHPTRRPTELSGISVWTRQRGEDDFQVGVRFIYRN